MWYIICNAISASVAFDEVAAQDKVVIVNKHSKPQSVIISYERYKKLKYEDEFLMRNQ